MSEQQVFFMFYEKRYVIGFTLKWKQNQIYFRNLFLVHFMLDEL